jgi:DNA repair protein RadC
MDSSTPAPIASLRFASLRRAGAPRTLSRAAAEPRPILRDALSRGAAAVILFHTHPSGDPTPSLEDLAFTHRMPEAAKIVGTELLDHLVIGGVGRWLSLRERGAF